MNKYWVLAAALQWVVEQGFVDQKHHSGVLLPTGVSVKAVTAKRGSCVKDGAVYKTELCIRQSRVKDIGEHNLKVEGGINEVAVRS